MEESIEEYVFYSSSSFAFTLVFLSCLRKQCSSKVEEEI